METFDCPKCKKQQPAGLRFVPNSDWCTPCVHAELFRQELESQPVQAREIVEYDPEDD